jgi:acetyl-CoA carboxylase carboxyl transferase subunit beta
VLVPTVAQDPLKFRDGRRYTDRLKDARIKTGLDDALLVGEGFLDGQPLTAAAQDFEFMAGSLGMAAGEAVIAGMLRAVEKRTPFILFAASGGARMQEGILSLMQMPRTTIAVQRLRAAKLPYIVVMTDPTTGGVTASYAMLGDVHIAEPGALICFAGPRVIQQTIREQLPDGFQRSEYLLSHGMIDMVVHRHKLRETLSRICRLLMQDAQSGKGIGKGRRVNGRTYANGKPGDGKMIETAARDEDAVIEAEPVDDAERFGAQGEARDKAKREPDSTTGRGSSKDPSRS